MSNGPREIHIYAVEGEELEPPVHIAEGDTVYFHYRQSSSTPSESEEYPDRNSQDVPLEDLPLAEQNHELRAQLAMHQAQARSGSLSLTEEEKRALERWLIGSTPRTYPCNVEDGAALDQVLSKLRSSLGATETDRG